MGGHYFSYSTSPFVGRLRVDLIFRQTPIGAGTATPMQATSFVAAVGTSQGAKSAIDDDLCPPHGPMVPAIPRLPGFSLFPSPLRQNVASDHHPHAAEAGLGPQRDLEHDPTAASFLFLFRGRLWLLGPSPQIGSAMWRAQRYSRGHLASGQRGWARALRIGTGWRMLPMWNAQRTGHVANSTGSGLWCWSWTRQSRRTFGSRGESLVPEILMYRSSAGLQGSSALCNLHRTHWHSTAWKAQEMERFPLKDVQHAWMPTLLRSSPKFWNCPDSEAIVKCQTDDIGY